MALTFPRADILDGLKFPASTPRMKPLWRQEMSRTAGGVTLVKDMGPLLWSVSYLTIPMTRQEAAEVEADLLSLENGAKLFLGYNPAQPYPAAWDGEDLSGVTVDSVNVTRTGLKLTGLPTGFRLTKGDWISVKKGDNLHLLQLVESGTQSATLETRPGIRPAIAAGDPVTLIKAPGLFMVDPGSVDRTNHDQIFDTVSWTATQVIT